MRIDELAYLRALAEDGHVPYAAEALGISQSTLTRAIGRLEADAGVELFDRHKNRLELNRYGEILLVHALRAQTELDNAQSRIDELREEIFGPVLAIVPFDDEDDAVRLANDTEYGLVSYVFTTDLARGQRMIGRLETGMMGLNVGVISNAAAPFGGIKQSGIGREGGLEGIHEYLYPKYTMTPID